MNLIYIIVTLALLATVVIAGVGVYAMIHGDKFDRQFKLAKIATDTLTLWVLLLVGYFLYHFFK